MIRAGEELATQIAEQLCRDAIWWEDACCFITPAIEPHLSGNWTRERTCNGSLYEGTAGIARFLGHYAARTGDQKALRLMHGCLAHSRSHIAGLGLYDGLAGIAAVHIELARLLDDSPLHAHGRQLLAAVAEQAPSQTSPELWDLIGGSAGIILTLGAVGFQESESSLVDAAVQIAEKWLSFARVQTAGLSWGSPSLADEESDNLCGLAHGASGSALACEVLGSVTSDVKWREVADAIRRYDRTGFDAASSNWVDLRADSDPSAGQPFWCHGSTGVAVDRLEALRLRGTASDTLLAEASAAVLGLRTWQDSRLGEVQGPGAGMEGNLCICHGLFGGLDLLLTASHQFEESSLQSTIDGTLQLAVTHGRHGPFPCGLQESPEAPGFMLGIAGIGYVALRSMNPAMPPATCPPLLEGLSGQPT